MQKHILLILAFIACNLAYLSVPIGITSAFLLGFGWVGYVWLTLACIGAAILVTDLVHHRRFMRWLRPLFWPQAKEWLIKKIRASGSVLAYPALVWVETKGPEVYVADGLKAVCGGAIEHIQKVADTIERAVVNQSHAPQSAFERELDRIMNIADNGSNN